MIPNVFNNVPAVEQAAPDLARLKKATNGFEVAFVKQLVTEMRKASASEFGDVPGSSVYEDMTNQVLAEKLSADGGFGIGNTMYKQLYSTVLAQAAKAHPVKKP